LGQVFLIALGVIDLQAAWQAIDATTIVFLLSMMVVSEWEPNLCRIFPACIIGIVGFHPQFVDSLNSW
jgi:hypothetical protein